MLCRPTDRPADRPTDRPTDGTDGRLSSELLIYRDVALLHSPDDGGREGGWVGKRADGHVGRPAGGRREGRRAGGPVSGPAVGLWFRGRREQPGGAVLLQVL